MKRSFQMFKTTVLGGLLFLLPLAVVLVVLGKLAVLMRTAAQPFDAVVPVDSAGGVLLVNVLAVLTILVACFLAGLLAARGLGKRVVSTVDSALVNALPGYTFVKGLTDSMAQTDEMSESFLPVVARFDDCAQLAFEVDRTEKGHVVVYLPGAPNPWSGTVVYMTQDRVERLGISVADAVKNIRTLGRGSDEVQAILGSVAR